MKLKIILSFFLVLTLWIFEVSAEQTGASFLKINVGARSAGMGSAFTAMANDASSLYWNPSGTAKIKERQVLLMHSEWISGMNYEFASLVQPTRKGAIGVGISYLSQGSFEGRNEDRKPSGDFAASDIAGIFSASRILGAASIGLNLKLIQQSIESEKASGFAFDMGGKLNQPGSPLTLGMTLKNVGPQMKFLNEGFNLPLTLSGGAAYELTKSLSLAVDVQQEIYTKDSRFNIGAEYWGFNTLALRTGYVSQIGLLSNSRTNGNQIQGQSVNLNGLGAGIGLKIFGYQVDYALVPYGELGNTHQISLLTGF